MRTKLATLCMAMSISSAVAGPTVIPTVEGQIGETLPAGDQINGVRFEAMAGPPGSVFIGGLIDPSMAAMEYNFTTDTMNTPRNPILRGFFSDPFAMIGPARPGSAVNLNGDIVAFSFAVDGSMAETMQVRLQTFDQTGMQWVDVPIDTVPTFPFPDTAVSQTNVAIDNMQRTTVVFTEFAMGVPRVRAQRIDGLTGTPIEPAFTVNAAALQPDIALLDPSGNRLIVPSIGPSGVQGNIVDFSGGTPVILPTFGVNTSTDPFLEGPVVSSNPTTGEFTIAWDAISGDSGNPVDVRARRFDAMGNPVGNDFVVNETTAGGQGQVGLATSPLNNHTMAVWASDQSSNPNSELDIFTRVFDANGNPITGEIQVNSDDQGSQDRPVVRFLPTTNSQGRPEAAVVWRDTEQGSATPRGTGVGYKCFSVGPTEFENIFADGFESGDTSSWCASPDP
ncbi:MAG: hypothetical protein DHS20C11_28790 [Lysobacteraceae bacterium]|nr:MAG: hypothetical protein DHS20C11_28790 [Xanthomonadaceae bacterium]